MRKPLIRVLIHLVWATWDRLPLLRPAIRDRVHAAIAEEARRLGCSEVVVGGVADHVHVVVAIPSTISIAILVQQLKGKSSHLVNHELSPGAEFRWQGGYAALSARSADYAQLRQYVLGQEHHHASAYEDNEYERIDEP